jgi:hypothetical protein
MVSVCVSAPTAGTQRTACGVARKVQSACAVCCWTELRQQSARQNVTQLRRLLPVVTRRFPHQAHSATLRTPVAPNRAAVVLTSNGSACSGCLASSAAAPSSIRSDQPVLPGTPLRVTCSCDLGLALCTTPVMELRWQCG